MELSLNMKSMPARDLSHPALCLTLYFLSFLSHFLFHTPLWTHCQSVLDPNLVFHLSAPSFFLFFFLFFPSFLPCHFSTHCRNTFSVICFCVSTSTFCLSCAICCHFYWFFYDLSSRSLLNSISISAFSGLCCFFPPQHLTFLSSFSLSLFLIKRSLVSGLDVSKSMGLSTTSHTHFDVFYAYSCTEIC